MRFSICLIRIVYIDPHDLIAFRQKTDHAFFAAFFQINAFHLLQIHFRACCRCFFGFIRCFRRRRRHRSFRCRRRRCCFFQDRYLLSQSAAAAEQQRTAKDACQQNRALFFHRDSLLFRGIVPSFSGIIIHFLQFCYNFLNIYLTSSLCLLLYRRARIIPTTPMARRQIHRII